MSMIEDLSQGRAYGEMSAASLNFAVKMVGYEIIKMHAMKPSVLADITKEQIFPVPANDPELKLHPDLKSFFYQREIGGELHTKIALGTAGKKIEN